MSFLILILIIIALYLLAIMPRIRNKPDMSAFMDVHYAHRGLHGDTSIAPENSLRAFGLARDNHYGIELDVQLSKDNVPVVFHDFNLKRVCGVDKKVVELTYEELLELRLYDSNEVIPNFQEVLDLIDAQVPLIIEYKLNGNNTDVCKIGDKVLKDYKGVYCIESFNPLALTWYRKNRPRVVRGQLSNKFLGQKGAPVSNILNFALQNLMLNFLSKPDFIAFNYEFQNMFSFSMAKKIFKVPTVAYTITSNLDIKNSLNKFDLFIFEGFIPE